MWSHAKITEDFLQIYTLNKIARLPNPVVILRFGTCELTDKRGRYIHIAEDLDSRLDYIKENYIKYKQQILSINNNAEVIYLECPYQL